MKLKRMYNPQDLERFKSERLAAIQALKGELAAKVANLPPTVIEQMATATVDQRNEIPVPRVDYLSLGDTGTTPEQRFTPAFVTEGLNAGWIELAGDEIILRAYPEDMRYQVARQPGRYCLHCGEKLADDAIGEMARLHIAQKHNGVASPDPNTPAGYVMLNYFECVLNAEQHEKYKAKPGVAPTYPAKES